MDPVTLAIANNRLGWVSVKDFGAVGDGVSNDTAAIQTAMDRAGDGVLLIPPGQYRFTQSLTVGSALAVFGYGATLIGESGAKLVLASDGITVEGLKIEGMIEAVGPTASRYRNITVKKCEINAQGYPRGIHFHRIAESTVIQNIVRGATTTGAYFLHCLRVNIDGNVLDSNGEDGLWIHEGGSSGDGMLSNPCMVRSNFVVNNGRHGVHLRGHHDAVVIDNNIERNGGFGINIHMPIETTVSSNMIEYNTGGGIMIEIGNSGFGAGRSLSNYVGNMLQGQGVSIAVTSTGVIPAVINITSNMCNNNQGSGTGIDLTGITPNCVVNVDGNTVRNGNQGVSVAPSNESDHGAEMRVSLQHNNFTQLNTGIVVANAKAVDLLSNRIADVGVGIRLLTEDAELVSSYNQFRNVTTPSIVTPGATLDETGNIIH